MRGPGFCVLLMGVAALAGQDVKEFEKRVTEFALPNGLQFLVVERHDAPAVSFHTFVHVGSADDPSGHTGLAYLFERVGFAGTESIGSKNWAEERKALDAVEEAYDRLEAERNLGARASSSRIDTLQAHVRLAIDTANRFGDPKVYGDVLQENGGTNVSVNVTPDATESSYSLPSNRLELWFLMESQRLMRPVFRAFYGERAAITEEQQKRGDLTAHGRLFGAFSAAAFEAHPYRNPAAGWPSDFGQLRRTDAKAFFDKYYVPANVTMTIVGDVNPADAKRLAEKYFGAWSARPLPPLVHTQEPPQPGPKTIVVESGSQPGITLVGYKRPSQSHPDDPVLDILQLILSQGRTGLLYKELVTDKHLAQSAQATGTFPAGRYPNIFLFVLTPSQGHTTDELQRALDELLSRLKQQKLDGNALIRAKAQARAALINRLAGNDGLARMLGNYQGGYGDWRKLFLAVEDFNKVSADDLQRVLLKYFVPAARTTVYTVLPGQSGVLPAPRPQQPGADKPGDRQ